MQACGAARVPFSISSAASVSMLPEVMLYRCLRGWKSWNSGGAASEERRMVRKRTSRNTRALPAGIHKQRWERAPVFGDGQQREVAPALVSDERL
jgi:hypothetical protein